MTEKKAITEEMNLHEEWFKEAKKQTLETLPEFINHIMNDYDHDYGTVCHAISACALAAAWAADRTDGACGGITGFQAGFIMWDFIRQWTYSDNVCGLRIVDFDNMLYPQYDTHFDKTITPRVWESIQKQAQKELSKDISCVHPDVVSHWENIVKGHVPFGYTVKER